MRFRRPLDEEPELNLIPLIDVMLIVLIFLAVTTTYSRFAELQIQLPAAQANPTQNRPSEVQIAVTADGRFAIDRKIVPFNDVASFAETLKAAAATAGQGNGAGVLLVINADAQSPHQAVVNVMEAARLAGLPRISFATQRSPDSAGR
jgi:biopolymer transport protein ExbD